MHNKKRPDKSKHKAGSVWLVSKCAATPAHLAGRPYRRVGPTLALSPSRAKHRATESRCEPGRPSGGPCLPLLRDARDALTVHAHGANHGHPHADRVGRTTRKSVLADEPGQQAPHCKSR